MFDALFNNILPALCLSCGKNTRGLAGHHRVTLATTGVVGIAVLGIRTPCTRQPTESTTDQGSQQILMSAVVAACKWLIVGSFSLHRVKLLSGDDGWHLRDRNPFIGLRVVVSANTVQLRRTHQYDEGKKKTKRLSKWHTEAIVNLNKERTYLRRVTIPENGLEDKVSHQIDMGLLQEVIPPSLREELLDTDQMWEEREPKTNMVTITSWLRALHLSPSLSQRRVYGKMVSGLRTPRDDVPEAIPVRSAFSYRCSQLGSEIMQELFVRCAGPKAQYISNKDRSPREEGRGKLDPDTACGWLRSPLSRLADEQSDVQSPVGVELASTLFPLSSNKFVNRS